MPGRSFDLDDIGQVTVYKRRGARNIRLSLAHDGTVRLSIPAWMPYRAGMEFAKQRRDWIAQNKVQSTILIPGSRIGKSHRLEFIKNKASSKTSVRLQDGQIRVILPEALTYSDTQAQETATRGAIRALTFEAEALLPQRLETLANKHGFNYKSVSIKRLKSRWGSCNQNNEIALNCYLLQLPWNLIDYVILHELVHTRILTHGPKFWKELALYVPELKDTRKTMRSQRPHLQATSLSD